MIIDVTELHKKDELDHWKKIGKSWCEVLLFFRFECERVYFYRQRLRAVSWKVIAWSNVLLAKYSFRSLFLFHFHMYSLLTMWCWFKDTRYLVLIRPISLYQTQILLMENMADVSRVSIAYCLVCLLFWCLLSIVYCLVSGVFYGLVSSESGAICL